MKQSLAPFNANIASIFNSVRTGISIVTELDTAIAEFISAFYEKRWIRYENPFVAVTVDDFKTNIGPTRVPRQELELALMSAVNPDLSKKKTPFTFKLTAGRIGPRPAIEVNFETDYLTHKGFKYCRVFVESAQSVDQFFAPQELLSPSLGQLFVNYINGTGPIGIITTKIRENLKLSTGLNWTWHNEENLFKVEHKAEIFMEEAVVAMNDDLFRNIDKQAIVGTFITIIPETNGDVNLCTVTIMHPEDDELVPKYVATFKTTELPYSFGLLNDVRKNIPDSGDRSRNEPVYLMSAKATRSLINDVPLTKALEAIRQVSKKQGWSDVQAYGQQLLFIS